MRLHPTANRCHVCGATNYLSVIARDGDGRLRPTGQCQCSGCGVVFADARAWRAGSSAAGRDALDAGALPGAGSALASVSTPLAAQIPSLN